MKMGTRAAFFVGDARDVENREWLGCIAWDGYPDGDCRIFAKCKSEAEFRLAVERLASERDDFAHPDRGGFPFPWENNLFLTDCVYAFFDGAAHVDMNRNWRTVDWCLTASEDEQETFWENSECDPTFENVPAPSRYDREQPDSIIIVSA